VNGRRQPAYEKSVFINCPFDSEYRELMLAIVFTVVAHGFVPRSARETDGTAEPRFSRILKMISESKYSIHDLSRFTGEQVASLQAEALDKETWADLLVSAYRTVPRS
jgi:hypothetical protein